MDSLDRKAGQDFPERRDRMITAGRVDQSPLREDPREPKDLKDALVSQDVRASEGESVTEVRRELRGRLPEDSKAKSEKRDSAVIRVWTVSRAKMVFPDSRVSRAKKASLAVWAKMEELGMTAEMDSMVGRGWPAYRELPGPRDILDFQDFPDWRGKSARLASRAFRAFRDKREETVSPVCPD